MNNSKIDEIMQLYKVKFPMGWIGGIDWTVNNGEDAFSSFQDKIKTFDEDAFFLISQSVLSGEFHNQSDFLLTLDSLFELLSNGELLDDETNDFKSIAIKTFNGRVYELERVARSYRYMLTELYNKYDERPTKYIVNAYKDIHRFKQNPFINSKYSRYYNIVLDVTRIDHLLASDKQNIMDLIIYHYELSNELEDQSITEKNRLALEVLNEKCLFLLKKLLIEDNKEFDYLIDFEHKHYDASRIDFKFFSELDRCFEFYRTESYKNDSIGNELDKAARNNKLKIGQFALLMKYYKDTNNTSQMQIDNILKDFDSLHDSLSSKFTKRPLDRYALGTLKNYMYNSRFSFMMKSSTYTFERVKRDLDEITEIQYQTGILNFYPYRKAFEKALDFFRKDDKAGKDVLNGYKLFLEHCISKLSEAIQWCRAYCFYPIQMVYGECLVEVEGFGEVFVASSFCKPVVYKDLKEELDTFRNQALLVDNEIALREEKIAMQNLKKDIDNSKTREVEVLSFFVGIITFLFGTIGFFANGGNNDFIHLIYSIFGLGAILLIFVSGIHLVTMRKEENVLDYLKHPRAWFCFVTILASIGLLIWLMINVNVMS